MQWPAWMMLAKESAASSLQVSGTKIKGFHFLPNAFIQSWGEFDLPAEIRMSPAKASKHSGTTWNNLFVDVCCIIVKQTICIPISALGFSCAKIIKRWRSARTTSRHHQCIRHLSRRIGSKTCKTKVLSVETMHGSGEKFCNRMLELHAFVPKTVLAELPGRNGHLMLLAWIKCRLDGRPLRQWRQKQLHAYVQRCAECPGLWVKYD